ncbi:hypothetical protein AB0K86_14255 [Streptomyces clavifer]|uniref:hypothetical protein n=1 Tax=Streptomyces TaxID=1883 RepID=UPI0007013EDE|nr:MULTISPECIES: hypothetical protein [unclassified Streptomyces]KQX83945.1 hypothetical protein ASD26_03265 [Streptomyces sp. Root1319]KQZ04507.1 hypothetical protein ASD51_16925 [Streptomyces sp. Root55]
MTTQPNGPEPGPVPGPRPDQDPLPPVAPLLDPGSRLGMLIRSQAGNPPGDATAYLCGAAHTDRPFRDAVITELAENPHRIPPPSYGVDLAAVLRECFIARRQAGIRGALLLVLPLLLMAVDVAGALTMVALVLYIRLFLYVARGLAGFLAPSTEPGNARPTGAGRAIRALIFLVLSIYLAGQVLAASVLLFAEGLFISRSVCRYNAVGESSCTRNDELNLTLVTALLVLVCWIVVATVFHHRTTRLLHQFATGRTPVRQDPPAHAARLAELRQQQADPDIVFSDYAPFVGAGIELDHWSFAIELTPDVGHKPDGTTADRPAGFTVPLIHARIRRELLRLGEGDAYPGDRMHGIRVDDYIVKSGLRLGPSTDWSGTGPDSAFQELAPDARREAVVQLGGVPDGPAPATWWPDSLDLAAQERLRHYLTVRVGSWGNEVVLTVFSRVQVQGGLLFLESRAFLLPPIARAFHAIDRVTPPDGVWDWFELVQRASASVFTVVSDAPIDLFRISRTAGRIGRSHAWYAHMCATNQVVDHSPKRSVRELAAEPAFQQLFQEMDVQRFLKSIQTRTLTAVRLSLRDAGYATGEYNARANIVFDHSVHVSGTVNGNVQSGDHARASHQTITTPQPRVGPRPDRGSTQGS